ncbi:MAG TPA: hypothetical protein VN452_06735 [Longilinea sp.]|nr:hypothetical protein [Longilinea sp.]
MAVFLLAGQIPNTPVAPATVQAGSGTTIDIPQSNIVPVMDGICDPNEYADAKRVSIYGGTNFTIPIFIKHSATDAYFCFAGSSGLPLPNGGLSHVVVYVDPLHDGDIYGSNANDFRVEMPYDPQGIPGANLWGTGLWNGSDPGGWQAVKYQTPEPSPYWQVEFKISRETLGGWKRPVGLALFYHWWRTEGDDFSWPEYGIWANAKRYGNGNLITGTVDIGNTATGNTMDGVCDNEYADASTNTFSISSQVVTSYYEHSGTDLYVCLKNLPIPGLTLQNQPNAVVYLTHVGRGGGSPSPTDIAFTISYDGTIQVGSGINGGYTGPVPNGYEIVRSNDSGGWDAEFRINSTVIGNWWDRSIGLSVAAQNINTLADFNSWPTGSSATVPNSWAKGNLIGVASSPHVYLPILLR